MKRSALWTCTRFCCPMQMLALRGACRLVMAILGAALIASPSNASATTERLYELVTETGMPHLDENLRYTMVREVRCIDLRDLSTAFWMLDDVSLQDCRLRKSYEADGAAAYALVCTGGHGTTGAAQWRFEANRITGTLTVKLGGKNMTFYQRVTGKPLGECAVP